jgi:signal transduction histidine kinase/ActR/RegA family two-component response regulator
VLAANYRGMVVPIIALYPLGALMAVVYSSFGAWIGLSLLVVPVIAAYAAIEHARQLRLANQELKQSTERLAASVQHNEELYQQLSEAHTQLSRAHQQLKETQEQVIQQERLRALGEMASGIAHDFNNALAPMVGFSELLLLQPEQWQNQQFLRRYLQLIHTAANDAAGVVRQLREFYRKREAMEVLLPLDLNPLVEQGVDITQPKWKDQAHARGVTITVTTDLDELPPVMGDETALREVLTNLIFNAVDAMPHGGAIRLRTRHVAGQAVLEVADGGTGMTEEVRQRCLDPFFTTKGASGTGLGLSMVHGIVQRHGGTLEIDSQWGRGTTMRIALPGCASQAPIAPTEGEVHAGAPSHQRHQGRTLHVLVVDDEETVRDVLVAYLASFGHSADVAANGKDGLHRFRTGRYDLVITDRAMPEMNGDLLAQAIKEGNPAVPVIMMTGFADMLNAAGEQPAGVDLVLNKPVLHADFRRALERLTTPEPAPEPAPHDAAVYPAGQSPAAPAAPAAPAGPPTIAP